MSPAPSPKRRPRTVLSGVLVIDKPRGPTSHDVVARVRRSLGAREVGHAGTLDPMATGVLVLAVGEATKLVPYLTSATKTYEATIALGVTTDTLDAEGRETARAPIADELRAALRDSGGVDAAGIIAAALAAELARTSQVPPVYSAIHAGGERAYEKARRGEEVALAPREVCVHELRLLDAGEDAASAWLTVAVTAAKGYYVRSFGRNLALALGTVGHLTALRRVRSGSFGIDEALPLDTPGDELAARVIALEHAAVRALPRAHLTEQGVIDARHGRPVQAVDLQQAPAPEGDRAPGVAAGAARSGPHAWLDPAGALVAVGDAGEGGVGRVLRGFGGGENG